MTIKLKGSSAGSVSFVAPADTSPSGTDVSLTLPTTAGTAGQYLKNSATPGTLEFGTLPASFNEETAVTLSAATHSITGLPSTTYYIQIAVSDFIQSADGNPLFRIGTSSGFSTTGYQGAASYNPTGSGANGVGTQYTLGFGILSTDTDASIDGFTIFAEFVLTDSNHWVYKHMGSYLANYFMIMGAGQKDLGGTLDRIQITSNSSATLSGSMKVRYWST